MACFRANQFRETAPPGWPPDRKPAGSITGGLDWVLPNAAGDEHNGREASQHGDGEAVVK